MPLLDVRSEIAGRIIQLDVAAGASVSSGDCLLLIESMKMEIPCEAPSGGVVQELCVAAGDEVEEGQLLARLHV